MIGSYVDTEASMTEREGALTQLEKQWLQGGKS